MARRTFIQDMLPNQLIEGIFSIQNCQLGLTRNGKAFLKCLLCDRTGRTPGRMWNASEELVNSLPTDGFVYIEGQTQPYQGEMQIIVQTIRPHTPEAADLRELLPSSERDPDEMFEQLLKIMQSMQSPQLENLLQVYLADKPLMENFKRAPAAMQLHHAYLGGLLEHTLALLKLAEATLPLYPQINRDIVLMGLFLHDLGKCEELTWESGFAYSDDGKLVGHIVRGAMWLESKARRCAENGDPLDPDVLRVLQHIILSHHGQTEFGAVKIPATPEAIFVSLLDNVDARMHMAIAAGRGESNRSEQLGGNFTERIWALGTAIYRPDPLAHETQPAPSRRASGGEQASSTSGEAGDVPELRLGGGAEADRGGL
ncbi:MAG: HD domain-containing protein [Phycisphaeraceae bacterium]